MLDLHRTAKAIGDANPEIAVFGIGAVEQHSLHLPVGTDWLGVRDITERVARELGALLVPALPFSMSECHGPMQGTVWLKPETLAAVVRDTVLSLRAQGIRKVLVVNGHGGNFVLKPEIRRINLAYPEMIVLLAPSVFESREGEDQIYDKGVGIHAGEPETSSQLYINPAHVGDDRVDYLPPVGREFLDYAFMGFISEWGVWGYPSYGTAEKGERDLTRRVARIVQWTSDAFDRVEAFKRRDEES